MPKASYKSKRGESGSQYRQCVTPCPRFITSGDTHSLCVVCLGANSRRTLFKEGVFASAPHGAGPASTEAERWLHSWGSQLDLAEGMETGRSLSLSSPARSTARSLGSEARSLSRLWRLRSCPPSRCVGHQRCWARGTRQQVRLVHAFTLWLCFRHIKQTCWKS